MDTKKLAVGQKIWMQSGPQLKEATVTGITEEYIEVKPVSLGEEEIPWMIRFQKDGKQFSIEALVKRTGSGHIDWKYLGNLGFYDWRCDGWERVDPRPGAGKAGFPWELVDKHLQ